ncbi:hypothetical protein K456DRAFT_1317505 [Colletotrichum gloeosporioides 23]|nr:hypothetical protein K456DRAFT_1317505 [Colletotrichum gloeosporioides 23]
MLGNPALALDFLVSWFPGFLVSWFPGFLVSWFPGFLVSWFPGFLVSWFPGFLLRFPGFLLPFPAPLWVPFLLRHQLLLQTKVSHRQLLPLYNPLYHFPSLIDHQQYSRHTIRSKISNQDHAPSAS